MQSYKRVYAEISLDAIKHNMAEIKEHVGNDTKVMAIIKADGYGHGAVAVAKAIDAMADYYGVAILEEAIELRKNGIDKPLLILGYTSPRQYADLVLHNVTQTIFDFETAKKLSETACSLNMTANIHIAIDTGMNRIGFKAEKESLDTIKQIYSLPNIFIEGIFTHFATADEKDKTFANEQYKRFKSFADYLEENGVTIPIKHICNSAGIIDFDYKLDMVRAGIILYGLYPSEDVDKNAIVLKPAMKLKTHVIFVKEVEAGHGISYGLTYVTDRKTRIATLPVGYADGYPRALSSKGHVIINGQYAPILGRVCMDQMMVDITGIDGVKIENDVTLLGSEGDCVITAEELGNMSESFNYEFICGVGKRVPRIFVLEGKVYETF